MSKPPRYLFRMIVRNFIDSFKPRASSPKLMGEDTLGNKYYESIPTQISHRTRPRRWFTSVNGGEGAIDERPTEWDAWLRGRRKEPPTPEEIAKNIATQLMTRQNAKQLEQERLTALASLNPEELKLMEASKELVPSKPGEKVKFPNYGNEYELNPGAISIKKDKLN